MEGFAGKRVVEVNDHFVFLDIRDEALETVAVGIHQRNDVAGIDGVFVKFSVDAEDSLVEFDDVFLNVWAVCLVNREREVEIVTFVQCGDVAFKSVEGYTKSRDKLEGVFYRSFLHEFVDALFVVGVEFVCNADVLVWLFHFYMFSCL